MWQAEFSRKEMIELCLGGYDSKRIIFRSFTGGFMSYAGPSYHAYWHQNPETAPSLPHLIVTPNGETQEFITAIVSSPQSPFPLTSLCRVLSGEEAELQFTKPVSSIDEKSLRATAILSMAEAVVHAEGKFSLKTLGPAACRRTLSYAWGRACATGVPPSSLESLAKRWIETYSLMGHSTGSLSTVASTIDLVIQILEGTRASSLRVAHQDPRFQLVQAILADNGNELEWAWDMLAKGLGLDVRLKHIAASSREERGGYLQQALRALSGAKKADSAVVGCAFLATQVAPKSLEHLEILRTAGGAEVALWYSFLAAAQDPLAVLSAYGGLGFRVLRDMRLVEDPISSPTSDISYWEMRIVSRMGIETVARRLGHVGEIEVELIPFVPATFTFPSRSTKTEPLEPSRREVAFSEDKRARIYDALNAIARVIEDAPEELVLTSPQAPTKRSYRKKS